MHRVHPIRSIKPPPASLLLGAAWALTFGLVLLPFFDRQNPSRRVERTHQPFSPHPALSASLPVLPFSLLTAFRLPRICLSTRLENHHNVEVATVCLPSGYSNAPRDCRPPLGRHRQIAASDLSKIDTAPESAHLWLFHTISTVKLLCDGDTTPPSLRRGA